MPYIILASIAVVIGAAVYRTRSPLAAGLALVTGGAITMGDLTVNGLLDLYTYHPHLLTGRTDNYVGVLCAEFLFVPSLYSLLAFLPAHRRFAGAGVIVILLAFIEELFLALRVYEQSTWTTYYSVAAFALFGLGACYWARSFERSGYTRLHRAVLVIAATLYASNAWGLVMSLLLGLHEIRPGMATSLVVDLLLGLSLYEASLFVGSALLAVWFRLTRRWVYMLILISGLALWYAHLQRAGIWLDTFWSPLAEAVGQGCVIYGLAFLDRWFSENAPPLSWNSGSN